MYESPLTYEIVFAFYSFLRKEWELPGRKWKIASSEDVMVIMIPVKDLGIFDNLVRPGHNIEEVLNEFSPRRGP